MLFLQAFKTLPHPTEHLHTPAVTHIISEKVKRKLARKAAREAGLDPDNLPPPPERPEVAAPVSNAESSVEPTSNKKRKAATEPEKDQNTPGDGSDSEESSVDDSENGDSGSEDESSESSEEDEVKTRSNSAKKAKLAASNPKAIQTQPSEDAMENTVELDAPLEVFDDSKEAVMGPFAEKVIKHRQVQDLLEELKKKLALSVEKLELFKSRILKLKNDAEHAVSSTCSYRFSQEL